MLLNSINVLCNLLFSTSLLYFRKKFWTASACGLIYGCNQWPTYSAVRVEPCTQCGRVRRISSQVYRWVLTYYLAFQTCAKTNHRWFTGIFLGHMSVKCVIYLEHLDKIHLINMSINPDSMYFKRHLVDIVVQPERKKCFHLQSAFKLKRLHKKKIRT